jgi:hypothetical protein
MRSVDDEDSGVGVKVVVMEAESGQMRTWNFFGA